MIRCFLYLLDLEARVHTQHVSAKRRRIGVLDTITHQLLQMVVHHQSKDEEEKGYSIPRGTKRAWRGAGHSLLLALRAPPLFCANVICLAFGCVGKIFRGIVHVGGWIARQIEKGVAYLWSFEKLRWPVLLLTIVGVVFLGGAAISIIGPYLAWSLSLLDSAIAWLLSGIPVLREVYVPVRWFLNMLIHALEKAPRVVALGGVFTVAYMKYPSVRRGCQLILMFAQLVQQAMKVVKGTTSMISAVSRGLQTLAPVTGKGAVLIPVLKGAEALALAWASSTPLQALDSAIGATAEGIKQEAAMDQGYLAAASEAVSKSGTSSDQGWLAYLFNDPGTGKSVPAPSPPAPTGWAWFSIWGSEASTPVPEKSWWSFWSKEEPPPPPQPEKSWWSFWSKEDPPEPAPASAPSGWWPWTSTASAVTSTPTAASSGWSLGSWFKKATSNKLTRDAVTVESPALWGDHKIRLSLALKGESILQLTIPVLLPRREPKISQKDVRTKVSMLCLMVLADLSPLSFAPNPHAYLTSLARILVDIAGVDADPGDEDPVHEWEAHGDLSVRVNVQTGLVQSLQCGDMDVSQLIQKIAMSAMAFDQEDTKLEAKNDPHTGTSMKNFLDGTLAAMRVIGQWSGVVLALFESSAIPRIIQEQADTIAAMNLDLGADADAHTLPPGVTQVLETQINSMFSGSSSLRKKAPARLPAAQVAAVKDSEVDSFFKDTNTLGIIIGSEHQNETVSLTRSPSMQFHFTFSHSDGPEVSAEPGGWGIVARRLQVLDQVLRTDPMIWSVEMASVINGTFFDSQLNIERLEIPAKMMDFLIKKGSLQPQGRLLIRDGKRQIAIGVKLDRKDRRLWACLLQPQAEHWSLDDMSHLPTLVSRFPRVKAKQQESRRRLFAQIGVLVATLSKLLFIGEWGMNVE